MPVRFGGGALGNAIKGVMKWGIDVWCYLSILLLTGEWYEFFDLPISAEPRIIHPSSTR